MSNTKKKFSSDNNGGNRDVPHDDDVSFCSLFSSDEESDAAREWLLPPFPSPKWSFRLSPADRVVVFDATTIAVWETKRNSDQDFLLESFERDDIAVITRGVVDPDIIKEMDPFELLGDHIGQQTIEGRCEIMMSVSSSEPSSFPATACHAGSGRGRRRSLPLALAKPPPSMVTFYESGRDIPNLTGVQFAAFLRKQIDFFNVLGGAEQVSAKLCTQDDLSILPSSLADLDLRTTTVYMKDVYLPLFAPVWHKLMVDNIKLPTVPFGSYCHMEHVSPPVFVCSYPNISSHSHFLLSMCRSPPLAHLK